MKSVLISGSSIAGPTAAYWLARQGFQPTLVERNPVPRAGGQAIDVRGAALRVIREMGLFDAVSDLRTRMKGFITYDADGREVARSEKSSLSGGRLDNDDIEILRDELSGLILEKVGNDAELIYGDSITGLRDEDEKVTVSFEKGASRSFDFVLGADGLHSNVRNLLFGNGIQFVRPLGIALVVFTAPNHIGLEDWQITYTEGDQAYIIYPARKNTELRVCFSLPLTLDTERRGDPEGQKALIAERFKDFRWEIPKLLEEMWKAPDFYLGLAGQVKMPHWSKGRVALVGDAGYCPSPFTGQGTSLALVGGYLLAHELGQKTHRSAFSRYESRMREFVDINQKIADLVMEDDYAASEAHQMRVLNALDDAKNAISLD